MARKWPETSASEIFFTYAAGNFRFAPWKLQISAGPARGAQALEPPRASGLRLRASLCEVCFPVETAHHAVAIDHLTCTGAAIDGSLCPLICRRHPISSALPSVRVSARRVSARRVSAWRVSARCVDGKIEMPGPEKHSRCTHVPDGRCLTLPECEYTLFIIAARRFEHASD
jgi:hypothetical protein